MDVPQAAANLLAAASAVVYCLVGLAVGRRNVSGEARVANRMFQLWWFGLATLTLYTPLFFFLGLLHLDTLGVAVFLVEGVLLLLVVALAGLVYYLLYVYSGKTVVAWPVAIYHFVMAAWLQWLLIDAHPYAFVAPPGGGPKEFLYEHDFTGQPAQVWLGILLVLPVLLSAIAYFLLYFQVEGRTAKYRIAVVSGALVVWFGSGIVATLVGLSQSPAWQFASMTISLASSLMILMAYLPPRWVRTRLGVASIRTEG
jgi:hypothetical protein